MSNPEGIDPDQLLAIARHARDLSENAQDWKSKSEQAIDYFQLQDLAYTVVGYCGEVSNEMFLLSELGYAKSKEMIDAANGGYCPVGDGEWEQYMAKLEASLDNSVGDSDPTKVSELDPKYAELVAPFKADSDFRGTAYRNAVAKAMAEGDMDAVKALTDALWDHTASMEAEQAKQFINSLSSEIVVTAIAASGIPPIPAVVEWAMNLGDYGDQYPRQDIPDDELMALIRKRFGISSRSTPELGKFLGNRLRNFADQSSTNARMVIFAAGKENPSVHLEGIEHIARAVRDAASKYPLTVAHSATYDDKWTQNFSDLIVQGATNDEVNAVVNAVADFAAQSLLTNGRDKDNIGYQDSNGYFGALGRLEKCLRKTDHGIVIDFWGVGNLILGGIPGGAVINKTLDSLDLVKPDQVKARREAQATTDLQRRNIALDMLCRTQPAKAQALLNAMKVGPEAITGLTLDDWSRAEGLKEENKAVQQLFDALESAFEGE